jgi:hypothetical protein
LLYNDYYTKHVFQETRPELDNWTQALLKATEAQKALAECDCSSFEVWEEAGQHGLRLLEERYEYCSFSDYAIPHNSRYSVSRLPKIGSNTDWNVQKLKEEIVKVLCGRRQKTGTWCNRESSRMTISDTLLSDKSSTLSQSTCKKGMKRYCFSS